MEIKAKTLKDKLYEYWIIIAFLLLSLIGISIMLIQFHNDDMRLAAARKSDAKLYQDHIKNIKNNHPILMCNKKIYKKHEYDLVKIGSRFYISTADNIDNPTTLSIRNCYPYEPQSNELRIKPKPVVPIDKVYEKKIEKLQNTIITLNNNINELNNIKTKQQSALMDANENIKILKETVNIQKKEIDRLLLVEAQSKLTAKMLQIVLDKKDLRVKDLVQKPIKPKPIKNSIDDAIVKANKIEDINVSNYHLLSNEIKSPLDRYKRIIYAVNYLNTHKTIDIPRPTKEDLRKIKVNKGTKVIIANKQLEKVITILSNRNDQLLKLKRGSTRKSILMNVGI